MTLTSVIAALALTSAAQASTVAQAKKEIRRLWGAQASTAMCIVAHESGWNPRAISHTDDHGLLQLHAPTWRRYFGSRWNRVYDPVENVRMGYAIYRMSGFQAWAGRRGC